MINLLWNPICESLYFLKETDKTNLLLKLHLICCSPHYKNYHSMLFSIVPLLYRKHVNFIHKLRILNSYFTLKFWNLNRADFDIFMTIKNTLEIKLVSCTNPLSLEHRICYFLQSKQPTFYFAPIFKHLF